MAKVVILKFLVFLATMHSTSAMAPIKRPSVLSAVSRGGAAGPLEPTAVAKVYGTACLLSGAQCVLAPKMDTIYGQDVPNECNAKTIRRIGLSILNAGVHVYCLLFKGYDMEVSATINSLMWMADVISSLLNNESETIGPNKAGDLSILAFATSVVYSALNDSPWFGTALKAHAVYSIVCGILLMAFPPLGVKLWGLKGGDVYTPGFTSICGAALAVIGTMSASLAWGIDPLSAVGYTCAAAAALDLKLLFFAPEVDQMGMNTRVLGICFCFAAITAASILISDVSFMNKTTHSTQQETAAIILLIDNYWPISLNYKA